MPSAYGMKMSAVQGGNLGHPKSFSDCDDRRVNCAQREVRVLPDELCHPSQVYIGEADQLNFPGCDRLQETCLSAGAYSCLEEVADLAEHRPRDEHRPGMMLEKRQTTVVRSVVGVEYRYQGARITDNHFVCSPRSSRR